MQGWIIPTLGALFMWGFWGFLPKLTTAYIDPKSAVIYEALGGFTIGAIALIALNFQIDFHPKGSGLAFITGMLGLIGAFCFLLAMSKGQVAIVATLSALYPVVSILLAVIFLHESIHIQQWIGIALAVLAMVLVAT
jgi:bacterial/archaeal transporter family protein